LSKQTRGGQQKQTKDGNQNTHFELLYNCSDRRTVERLSKYADLVQEKA